MNKTAIMKSTPTGRQMKEAQTALEQLSDKELMQKITALSQENVVQELPPTTEKSLEEAKSSSEVSNKERVELSETVRDYICQITGVRGSTLARLLFNQASYHLQHIRCSKPEDQVNLVRDLLEDINPQNANESMLAVQMIGVYQTAISLLLTANHNRQGMVSDVFIRQSVQLMRLFNEQLEAMARLKGKTGQQRVIVEHVNVNAGRQAIVGTVDTGKKDKGEGGK